ncbi:MAG: HD-GYP domain-containing protein [Desulfarculus sp.]|nr:HD-GYP domain-containing protein [Desulfarculus sp.]
MYFSPEYRVSVDLLQPGVFVRLEGQWFNHPFLFSKFKIKNQKQIDTLKSLGITEVICVPEKSDRLPLGRRAKAKLQAQAQGCAPAVPAGQAAAPATCQGAAAQADPYLQELWRQKNERIERLKERREVIERTEECYNQSVHKLPTLMQNLMTGSEESVEQAGVLVGQMVDSLLEDSDAVVHLVNIRGKEENIFYHSLNVAVLALVLGSQAGLGQLKMRSLGMGALFHDVGKNNIPKKVLKKETPLTKPEQALLRLHPKYGVDIVSRCGNFPPDAAQVIQQHHEALDGQGYPDGLKGDEISHLARITAIVDRYDKLCNQPVLQKSLTPYQALAYMYKERKNQLDHNLLVAFIRCLGVYPPGTIVQLNNQALGLVISVNSSNPLKPSLMIYDPDIPKQEALILDMEDDPDLAITGSIHPCQLPGEVFDYLSPRTRITYYVEDRVKPVTRA